MPMATVHAELFSVKIFFAEERENDESIGIMMMIGDKST